MSTEILESPHNLEVEQAFLSILLYDNAHFEYIPEYFKSDHFFHPLHQKIYDAIVALIQRGHLASPITLVHFFAKEEQIQGVEGYLAKISGLFFPAHQLKDYARQLHELFLRRQLIGLGQELVSNAQQATVHGPGPREHIENLEHRLFQLTTFGSEKSVQPFSYALQEALVSAEKAYKRDSHVVGVTTGFVDLDRLLGGLHPSDLVILAARPSMGKTALATNIAFNAAFCQLEKKNNDGAAVVIFSLEMSSSQLAMRLLGQETGIPSDRIRRGAIDQSHFPLFVEVTRRLSELPLFIDDTPALSIGGLLTRARRLKRKENIGMIVIDYLQLITTGRSSSENRVQELSEITRGLKALAKELNVPVLALSQLSRAVEQREDKRPQLADLRESGSIEQDADVVMFIYREEYYEARKKPTDGSDKMALWQSHMAQIHNMAEVIVAKQRHGPIATVSLYFDGQRTKFSNAAPSTNNS